jgi:hypothetical protein
MNVVETISRLDFGELNRILSKLSHYPIYLDLPDGFKSADTIDEVEKQSLFLLDVLQKAKNAVNVFSDVGSGLSLGAIPAEKRYIYEKVKFPLRQISYALGSQIDECIDDLETIQSRVLFLIARAGQGKTNFVCDFAENVLRKRSLLCLFFTGQELRHVDPDKIGEYMVRSVFGDKYNGSMEEMLRDLERMCLTDQAPVTTIIDGINEHGDIGVFSHRLERLVEKILEYDYVKLILTCRSEYFDQRFHNFRGASFAGKICFVEDLEQCMSDTHRDHLLKAYFHFFKLYCPHLSWRARKALERDTVLLRMFCEAYGDHTAEETIPLPQLTDIYQDEIFRIYLDKKLEGASQYYDSSSRLSVGVDARYQRVLSRIIHLMIEREQFANIPVSDLDEEHHAALGEMIGEDIIFRKDLVGRSLLDEKREVINFTFDEFRDFLLADHLVMKTFKEDAKAFAGIVERLTRPKSPVAEGISKFIFFASKRPEGEKVHNVIADSPWYKEVFLECIFSVQEKFITQDDLREIESRFFENIRHSSWTIFSLIPRYRTDLYSVLNIDLLFRILDKLDESEYDKLVRPVFSRRGVYRFEEERYWPIEELANDIREILMNEDLSCWPCFEKLVELLIYLFDIRDRDHTCPAFTVFREFAETYTDVAIGLLERRTRIRNSGIAAQVWDMLTHLSRKGDMPKELVDEGCQLLAELDGGEDAKQSRLARAVALFLVSCRNSMGIELSDEVARRIKKIIAAPLWFGEYHGRAY